jgi:hypothetical protein
MTTARMLQRPIYGGVFGHGQYSLATVPTIANGLHAVRFMVLDPRGGAVLAAGESKIEVIARARVALNATTRHAAANDERWEQAQIWPDLEPGGQVRNARRVSRRRREVFDRSLGRCHYCNSELQLQGPWHVEHMVPKALDGNDHPLNLVAACVRCNLSKSDRTAIEFITSRMPAMPD